MHQSGVIMRRRPRLSPVVLVMALACLPAGAGEFAGRPYEGADTFADTWVATDALGREAPGFEETGPVKPDKW
ncbi:MAG TPA: hypothetical protein PLF51_12665, partial [Candidatus Hydrogenedentes bacterium]|nr:hypothetical protein [Candidatus Hydrogenedentota bacterium]